MSLGDRVSVPSEGEQPGVPANGVEIPAGRISPEALDGLIEEFVTRDGTDYGEQEQPLEQKKRAVARQIDHGEVVIVFDPDSETCNIIPKDARMTP